MSIFLLSAIPFLYLPGISDKLHSNFWTKIIYFMLFLPNLALVRYAPIPYASQAWSVGVEEQFYLIWPVLMKKFKNKLPLLYFIIIFYVVTLYLFLPLLIKVFESHKSLIVLKTFLAWTSIDCMAIGGIFAIYLFRNDKKKLNFLFNIYFQILAFLLLVIFIGFGIHLPYLNNEFYALLFGILIINLAANPKPLFNLENKVFNYLGKISYGLYMYHPIAVVIALKLLYLINFNYYIPQLIASLLFTIIISSLSYKYLESWFIKRKVKFSKLISGDNATQ
jgi:peptidoglycan/LPS O-acetylase OafA/YrhL